MITASKLGAIGYTSLHAADSPTEILIYFHGLYNGRTDQISVAQLQAELDRIHRERPGVVAVHIDGHPNGWHGVYLDLDQIVQEIESQYGFRCQRLTIAGHSAGGLAVLNHIRQPLVRRAILLDATYWDFSGLDNQDLQKIYMIDGQSTRGYSIPIAGRVGVYRQNINLTDSRFAVPHTATVKFLSGFYLKENQTK